MTQKYLAFLCQIKVPLAGVNLILCQPSEVTDGDHGTDAKTECVPHIRVTFLKDSPGCFIPLMSSHGSLCPQDKLYLCHWTPQPFTAHASIINLLPLHSLLRTHCSHPVVPHASAAQVSCTLSSSSQAWAQAISAQSTFRYLFFESRAGITSSVQPVGPFLASVIGFPRILSILCVSPLGH